MPSWGLGRPGELTELVGKTHGLQTMMVSSSPLESLGTLHQFFPPGGQPHGVISESRYLKVIPGSIKSRMF